ncbi:Membrane protein involved in the export of O-antigen and teichoic acid [Micromonospora chersina]|uniref:Membrane protein involved in the export of O-antigen and teichoic acid n=1 Tax=Micromonospora chersina TaxID=47854 RepID=A0A1C6UME7_9ACTN|nr:Membrane protein involved in the export of O-antigen and teichoic acid [Micromonospora chersina]
MPRRHSGPGASPFYRHVSHLAISTALAQGIAMLTSVFLARLYAPREFGEFSIALSLALIVATAATLRLEMAIPLAEDDREAVVLTATAVVAAVLVAVAMLAILVTCLVVSGRRWSAFGAGAGVLLVPAMVAALGTSAAARMLQSRRERFAAVSGATVLGAAVQGVGQLVAAPLGATGLTGGYVAGRVCYSVALLRRSGVLGVRSAAQWWSTTVKWRRFALLTSPPALLNMISVGAIAPVVAVCYGVTVSGLFAFATRLLTLPAALIGQAVGSVFFPKIAALERDGGDVRLAVERVTTGLVFLSVPTFGFVLLLGPELYVLAFGAQWRTAGSISALLAPWLAASFVSSPLSTLMTVKDRLRSLLLLSGLETALRLGSLASGLLVGSATVGIGAYSLSGLAISVGYVGWSLRLAGSSLRGWAGSVRGYLLLVGAAYPVLLAARGHLPQPVATALAVALTAVLLGFAVRWLHRNRPGGPEGTPKPSVPAGDGAGTPVPSGAHR